MGCPNTIVPGLEESEKAVKATPALAMKMEQLLSEKKLKRNWIFMEAGKISSEQRRARDAQAIEGLYRPYKHIEQEIVRREGLRGDSHIKGWFQNLREKVATGEMSDEQRREVLIKRVNKKLKPPGDDMAFLDNHRRG